MSFTRLNNIDKWGGGGASLKKQNKKSGKNAKSKPVVPAESL